MLVLASASPRRRELLGLIADDFDVRPTDIPEELESGSLEEAVASLALRKAVAAASDLEDEVVLGADTIVVIDGDVLGKPAGVEQARAMLRRLRGREHRVLTGIAVVDGATRRAASDTVASRVLMAPYADEVIEAYVRSGEPLDKAGAYAIQGLGGELIAGLVGSYTNVIGLPLERTRRLLVEFGVRVKPEAAS